MTARDLLQQRMTLPNGDTAWRPSPLVTAAINGSLAILDGLHRINAGTLAVLQRCVPLGRIDVALSLPALCLDCLQAPVLLPMLC